MKEYDKKLSEAIQSWQAGLCKNEQAQLEADYSTKDTQELLYETLGNDIEIYKNAQKILRHQYPSRESTFNTIDADLDKIVEQTRIDKQIEQAINLAIELSNNMTNDSSPQIIIDLVYLSEILSNLMGDS